MHSRSNFVRFFKNSKQNVERLLLYVLNDIQDFDAIIRFFLNLKERGVNDINMSNARKTAFAVFRASLIFQAQY